MTVKTILVILGIGETIIQAIGDLIDINEEVTPEMIADLKQQIADAEQGWADA